MSQQPKANSDVEHHGRGRYSSMTPSLTLVVLELLRHPQLSTWDLEIRGHIQSAFFMDLIWGLYQSDRNI